MFFRKAVFLLAVAAAAGAFQAGMGGQLGAFIDEDTGVAWNIHAAARTCRHSEVGFGFGRETLPNVHYDEAGDASSFYLTVRAKWPLPAAQPYFGVRAGLSTISYVYMHRGSFDDTNTASWWLAGGGPGVEISIVPAVSLYAEGGYHVYLPRTDDEDTLTYGAFDLGLTWWVFRPM